MTLKYYQSELIPFSHAFFTRLGGVSHGIYDSLNMSIKGIDAIENVTKNKEIIADFFALPLSTLKIADQVHGSNTVIITHPDQDASLTPADAVVTNLPNIILGVKTADCCPLFLCDFGAHTIATVHAGHKGAFSGVIQSAVNAMLSIGAKKQNIIACLGPSIAVESYEVDESFKQRFLMQSLDNKQFFYPKNQSHHLFDLKAYVKYIVLLQGITEFDDMNIDTYKDRDFFSCRRSYHDGQSHFGTQLSAICIK